MVPGVEIGWNDDGEGFAGAARGGGSAKSTGTGTMRKRLSDCHFRIAVPSFGSLEVLEPTSGIEPLTC